MDNNSDKRQKKEIMKDIILKLHEGLTVEKAKERFESEVGSITSTEIAEIEQSLIDDGLSPDEIKKFCNVHALLFQSELKKAASDETFPSHPVYLFKLENRQIEKRIAPLKELVEKKKESGPAEFIAKTKELLSDLRGIDTHYERKEQVLFPFLEKHGFFGPSKVMWGKDNEIRDLLKKALSEIENIGTKGEAKKFAADRLLPLVEEVEGMIFKEENILFPTSLEKLAADDWAEVLRESDEVGYAYIEKPAETETLLKNLKEAFSEEPVLQKDSVGFPTGSFGPKELMAVLNTLPFDMTFVDKDDTVRYFSDGKDRIFSRTKAVIGRKVQNCHPPQSVDVVEKILNSFKEKKKDFFEFWLTLGGRDIHIRYFAVRDNAGKYLGTLEVSQDITEIKKLKGEKRLLDERD